MTERGTDDLADAVQSRRVELGLTQEDLVDRTQQLDPKGKGISLRSIGDIERANRPRMYASTMRLLDRSLEWPVGTTAALLEGREPPSRAKLSEDDSERLRALEAEVTELRDAVADLIEIIRVSDRLAARRERLLNE